MSTLQPVPSAPPLRERVVRAAVELTADVGWARVTMAGLADQVGVSRQTVYNEMGTKAGLAEAMILHELERFLGVVTAAFDAHPDDLVAAIETASRDVLTVARGNQLLHAVVSATHGADTDLLPLLTTHSHSLLTVAKAVILERIPPYDVPLAGERLEAAIDMIVRVVLSHVMQPTASPERTARDLAWIAARVLHAER